MLQSHVNWSLAFGLHAIHFLEESLAREFYPALHNRSHKLFSHFCSSSRCNAFLFSSTFFFTSFISPLKLKFIASFWFMVETVCLLLLVRFHREREKREVELVQTFCKCATAPVQTFTYVSPLPFPPFTRAVNIAEEFICYWRIKWKRQVRNCLDSSWDSFGKARDTLHKDLLIKSIKEAKVYVYATFSCPAEQ